MDSQSQDHGLFSSFGTGIARPATSFSAYHYPSRERPLSRFEEVGIDSFAHQIPTEHRRSARITTRQVHHEIDNANADQPQKIQRRSRTTALFWPTFILVIPITLLAAALLAVVFLYKVQTAPDVFQPEGQSSQGSSHYILVNFSATRLVFLASVLSSIAPVLTSFVMIVWTLPVADCLRQASLTHNYAQLPTPYQLSLVVGLTLASYERLGRYLAYLFSRSRSEIPQVVHRAAGMMILATCLTLACFGSDAALHFTTSTVDFIRTTQKLTPDLQYGRGLSEYCLDFNRTRNYGIPCSYNMLETDPNALAETNEVFRLQGNISRVSELLVIENPALPHGDMVIIAQQSATLDSEIDYVASTIGISSQCHPISTKCDMRTDPDTNFHTRFNCTDQFWGLLGAPPNISQTYTKAVDANVPGLAYKPASNLEYAFFNNSDLSLPYNSVGWDAFGNDVYDSLTDAELINPIYSAFAGRISYSSESAGSLLNADPEMFINASINQVTADFVLNCTITSYDVNLTFSNGSVQAMEFEPTKNGSILEIFHGIQFYVNFETGAPDLQSYLSEIALQNTSADLAKAWGNLYSQKIMATIGGYTTPRMNLQEQQRKTILVASVSKAALGALVGCSMAYTVLGIVLCFVAIRSSAAEVRDLAAQLSLAGLVTSVFGEKPSQPSSAGTDYNSGMYDQGFTRREKQPIVVGGNPTFDFRTWV